MSADEGALPWRRDEPESPCVRVCLLDPETGLCLGCRRTRDEIASWVRMTPEQRRAVLAALPGRTVPRRRRGGRAARRAARAGEVEG